MTNPDNQITEPAQPQGKLFKSNTISQKERAVLARSVLLEETAPSGMVYGGIWLIAFLVLAAIIWASLMRLDERASAPGDIITVSRVTPIQHLEGGIVAAVLVSDGQKVAEGDTLIRLDPTAARTEFSQLKARQAALFLQIARLRATAFNTEPDFGDYAQAFPQLLSDQVRAYESDLSALAAQTRVADAQIEARREELRGLQGQEASLREQATAIDAQVEIQKGLAEQQLARRTVLLETQKDAAEIRGRVQQVMSDQARALAAITEAEGRKLEARERLRRQSLERLGTLAGELAEVEERIHRLEDRFARTDIKAPTGGIVAGLKLARGSVIAPGDTLMRLVPANDTILAQVRISPSDIGYIVEGQSALVKVDTYSFARYGGVPGIVEKISATSFKDPEGHTYFEAVVALDHEYVGNDPKANRITSGMTLTADIKTGEKSLMAYLWRPVSHSLNAAFGER